MKCDDCSKEADHQCDHCGRKTCCEHYDMETHPLLVQAWDFESGRKVKGFFTADEIHDYWQRSGRLYNKLNGR